MVHSVKAGPVPQASRDQLIAEWKSWIQEAGMLLSSVNVMADPCIWPLSIFSGTWHSIDGLVYFWDCNSDPVHGLCLTIICFLNLLGYHVRQKDIRKPNCSVLEVRSWVINDPNHRAQLFEHCWWVQAGPSVLDQPAWPLVIVHYWLSNSTGSPACPLPPNDTLSSCIKGSFTPSCHAGWTRQMQVPSWQFASSDSGS